MTREQAEIRYVTGTETLKEISAETGVNLRTLERWCKECNWVEKRQKANDDALKMAVKKRVNKRAQQLAKVLEALEEAETAGVKMTGMVLEDLENYPRGYTDQDGNQFSNLLDGNRARAFKDLSEAIRNLTGIRMTVDEILTKQEKEKLAIEKRKLKLAEKAADKETETNRIEVTFGDGAGELFE